MTHCRIDWTQARCEVRLNHGHGAVCGMDAFALVDAQAERASDSRKLYACHAHLEAMRAELGEDAIVLAERGAAPHVDVLKLFTSTKDAIAVAVQLHREAEQAICGDSAMLAADAALRLGGAVQVLMALLGETEDVVRVGIAKRAAQKLRVVADAHLEADYEDRASGE